MKNLGSNEDLLDSGDDEFEFDLEPGADDELEIVDDTPEQDRGKYVAAEETADDEDDEEEIPDTSERVKKRFAKLTAERHAERRAKEAVARERDEAAAQLKQAIDYVNQLQQQTASYEQGFVAQAKSRVESQLTQAQADYKAAFETGDVDRMVLAQTRISELAPEKIQYERYTPPEVRQIEVPQARQAPAQTSNDELQVRWMQDNPWFNQDAKKTQYAIGVHTNIVSRYPQAVGTPEYYSAIDAAMKDMFPDLGEGQGQSLTREYKPRASAVAPVVRGNGKASPRKVTLTQTQVKLAKRMGVPLADYARQVAILDKENNDG